jgi:hypothetical protein
MAGSDRGRMKSFNTPASCSAKCRSRDNAKGPTGIRSRWVSTRGLCLRARNPVAVKALGHALRQPDSCNRLGVDALSVENDQFACISLAVIDETEKPTLVLTCARRPWHHTGFPFGHYFYTGHLGPKLGQVPLLIMPAYFAVGYVAWRLAHVLLGRFDERIAASDVVLIPVFAAFLMVMWDLCMDPVSSTVQGAWIWRDGGAYFGVPAVNFLGWYLCTYTIFQTFALYLSARGVRVASAERGKTAVWSLPAYMYGALTLNSFLPPLLGPDVQILRGDHHVWWNSDIHTSMALIALFTMVFVTLLALVHAHRRP